MAEEMLSDALTEVKEKQHQPGQMSKDLSAADEVIQYMASELNLLKEKLEKTLLVVKRLSAANVEDQKVTIEDCLTRDILPRLEKEIKVATVAVQEGSALALQIAKSDASKSHLSPKDHKQSQRKTKDQTFQEHNLKKMPAAPRERERFGKKVKKETKRELAISLWKNKFPLKDIRSQLGYSERTLRRILALAKCGKMEEAVKRKGHSGRKLKIATDDEIKIRRVLEEQPSLTAAQLKAEIPELANVTVRTIQRVCKERLNLPRQKIIFPRKLQSKQKEKHSKSSTGNSVNAGSQRSHTETQIPYPENVGQGTPYMEWPHWP